MDHIPQARILPFKHQPEVFEITNISSEVTVPQGWFKSFASAQFPFQSTRLHGEYRYADPPHWGTWIKFLQGWGFFELLKETCRICGLTYEHQRWLKGGFVHTAYLETLSMKWEEQRVALSREDIERRLRDLDECLFLVSQHVIQAFPEKRRADTTVFLSGDVKCLIPLSVQLLLEHLGGWVTRFTGAHDIGRTDSRMSIRRSEYLFNRLRAAHWQLEEIQSMERLTAMSYSHMLMVSSIDRKVQKELRRKYFDVKEKIHAPGCKCDCTTFNERTWVGHLDEVRQIIDTGKTPILSITGRVEDGTTRLRIEAAQSTDPPTPYVAISHVWADGLEGANGYLPNCQLHRVQSMVDKLISGWEGAFPTIQTPVRFWLDPICVPKLPNLHKRGSKNINQATNQDETQYEDNRFNEVVPKALKKMGDIYRDAAAVLVLDSAIYSVPLNSEGDLPGEKPEIHAARVAYSNWMSRGWTFQEACLTSKLFFQFRETTYNWLMLRVDYARAKNIRTGIQMMVEVERRGKIEMKNDLIALTDPCYTYTFSQISSIWRWLDEDEGHQTVLEALRRLYYRLSERGISNPDDEAHILRNLLINRTKLTHDDEAQRIRRMDDDHISMRGLFKSFTEVPLELLFWDGNRYTAEGERWIPTSILRPVTRPEQAETRFGRELTTRSMRVLADGSGVAVRLKGVHFRVESQRKSGELECSLRINGVLHLLQFRAKNTAGGWDSLADQDLVLLVHPEVEGGRRFDTGPASQLAVLTSRRQRAGEDVAAYLRFEAVITASPLNEAEYPTEDSALQGTLMEETTEDTLWCIG